MAGLVPAIHDLTTALSREVVDARHKGGHDAMERSCASFTLVVRAPRQALQPLPGWGELVDERSEAG